ncbi:MAG TPA: radical SAM protein [Acidimicrobiia bacterium]|nr:radical SAM protein [Acidimicrobiia bacterium]
MRIALIAMSGVRAYNPELTALGLSLPGFVERGRTIASLPSLGLLTLAALTDDRFDVDYYEVDDIADLDPLPGCDVAALSSYSAQVKDAYALSERFRAEGVTTVIGGLHVTALPDEALAYCDAVVVGEGEPVWEMILDDALAGNLAGIYRSDGSYDLANAPIPRYDLLDPERYNRLTVQTQRGCPWRCEFCASSVLLSPRYKLKPSDKVGEEIRAMKEIWANPFVELSDDNTFVAKRRSHALVEAIGHEGVSWFTETDASVADDPVLLDMMREAGCREILIGFESLNPAALNGLETRRNWKLGRLDEYRSVIETVQESGIAVNACFVLGLDGDGPEAFDSIKEFVDETNPFDVQITVLTAFPGTPLYRRLMDEGRIIEPGAWEKCTLFDVNFEPMGMTVAELESGLVELGRYIYSEGDLTSRRAGFKAQVRSGADRRSREVMTA